MTSEAIPPESAWTTVDGHLVASTGQLSLVTDGYHPLPSVQPVAIGNATNTTSTQRDESLARLEILVQIIILALALIGNSCVLTALARRGKAGSRMHMFIFHLSIADLLVAIFNILPQLIWDITETFVGGDFLCRFVKFMQVFVMYLSTYMLVMTAVDRYLSVCHPLSSFNTSSKTKVYLMIAFAYALSAVLSLPQPIIFKYQEQPGLNVYDCWAYFDPVWTLNLYVTSFTVAVYLIPLLILIYTYVSICYAIWQKQKHSQPQCQLDALEKTTCLSQAPNARGGGCTGTGGIPGKKSNSSGSRTHSTSSPYDPRDGGPALPGEKQTRCLSCTGGCATNRLTSTNIHYHNHIHHHHHYQHSSKYGAGPGTRCALMEGATGITPSGLLSAGRFREKREGRHGRAEREEGGRKRSSSKSLANKRQTVGRSNAIRRRVNLVVTAANGSTRSSTGSVRGLSRAKMKTVKLTFVVIMAYVVCWTPFFVSQLWWLYDESQENNDAVVIMILLGSLNSCCNPLIYLSFSGKIMQRVGLRRRSSPGCCSGRSWRGCYKRYSCDSCGSFLCWPRRQFSSCVSTPQHNPDNSSKHGNNNSSNREDHNKEGQSLRGDGGSAGGGAGGVRSDQIKAGFKVASGDVCTAGIGVVPSIELRDFM